jgi:DNA polymerase-1
MRLLAAASQEAAMMEIFHRNWDIHMGNASLVFDIPYEDIVAAKNTDKKVKDKILPASAMTEYVWRCLKARGDAKTIGFGLNYGMKEHSLAARMGCTVEEAVAKIEQYMAKYPAVRAFFKEAVDDARRTGYAFTLLGRRRYLPDLVSSDEFTRYRAERQASNMPIQGTAAEVCKMAMINIYEDVELRQKYGYMMCLQVHDEIAGECPEEFVPVVKERVREWMEHPFPTDIGVPLLADIGSADTWGDAK